MPPSRLRSVPRKSDTENSEDASKAYSAVANLNEVNGVFAGGQRLVGWVQARGEVDAAQQSQAEAPCWPPRQRGYRAGGLGWHARNAFSAGAQAGVAAR